MLNQIGSQENSTVSAIQSFAPEKWGWERKGSSFSIKQKRTVCLLSKNKKRKDADRGRPENKEKERANVIEQRDREEKKARKVL